MKRKKNKNKKLQRITSYSYYTKSLLILVKELNDMSIQRMFWNDTQTDKINIESNFWSLLLDIRIALKISSDKSKVDCVMSTIGS